MHLCPYLLDCNPTRQAKTSLSNKKDDCIPGYLGTNYSGSSWLAYRLLDCNCRRPNCPHDSPVNLLSVLYINNWVTYLLVLYRIIKSPYGSRHLHVNTRGTYVSLVHAASIYHVTIFISSKKYTVCWKVHQARMHSCSSTADSEL